ncbi:MAG TPA: proprotein convertase P-domain-containing protein, partial [Chlamydiales bacterium]|nr:proprotein convertase P-domain-containing protein [Chlamydiales bacterium]
ITKTGIESSITITKDLLVENNFEKLEHITVKIWVNHTTRGDVEVQITSPNHITSILAGARPRDSSSDGYPGWIFSSIKHWCVVLPAICKWCDPFINYNTGMKILWETGP